MFDQVNAPVDLAAKHFAAYMQEPNTNSWLSRRATQNGTAPKVQVSPLGENKFRVVLNSGETTTSITYEMVAKGPNKTQVKQQEVTIAVDGTKLPKMLTRAVCAGAVVASPGAGQRWLRNFGEFIAQREAGGPAL